MALKEETVMALSKLKLFLLSLTLAASGFGCNDGDATSRAGTNSLRELARILREGGSDLEFSQLLDNQPRLVNERLEDGMTLLILACKEDRLEFARILLEHGAQPNQFYQIGRYTYSPLSLASANDNYTLTVLLIESGALVDDADCTYPSVLNTAIYSSSVDLIRYLMTHADSSRYSSQGFDGAILVRERNGIAGVHEVRDLVATFLAD